MAGHSASFPWPSYYGHFDYFERMMQQHRVVASLAVEGNGVCRLARANGDTLRTFICECYALPGRPVSGRFVASFGAQSVTGSRFRHRQVPIALQTSLPTDPDVGDEACLIDLESDPTYIPSMEYADL